MPEAHDETSARTTLLDMMGRIAQGPHAALGIAETASAGEVRAAFLQLTKQYHPARFGRMSSELQKLSNEVFLALKAAHDALVKAAGGVRSTGTMPVVQAESSQPHARPTTGATPALQPRQTGAIPVVSRAQTGAPPPASAPPAATPQGTTPPPARPTTPTGPSSGRTPTPTLPRAGTPPQTSTPTRPGTPPQQPTRMSQQLPPLDPATGRAPAATPIQRTAPVFDERVALQSALDLMRAGDFKAAREALHALAARVPQSKQYRALLCFARGREAHVGGRLDEASLEYQRALQLDPDLVQAKQALGDLQRRR